MSQVRVKGEPGFVLHWRPYSESSLLLELYSRSFGRITAIAKGARGKKSPYRGTLRPFALITLGWSGKGEVKTLTQGEWGGPGAALAGSGLFCGFYLNELLIKFLHRYDPHERLFDRYWQCIHELLNESNQESALRYFEKVLLEEIGYGLQLEHDQTSGEQILAASRYRYQPGVGAFVEQADDQSGIRIHGESLIALRAESPLSRRSQREVKQLHRAIFHNLLEGRTLVSRSVYSQLYTIDPGADANLGAPQSTPH
ncbi:MAG: DNA repair protein RecO [Acidiferrobacteraceae bacterium]|nr:DNA repair protein RecO [Acidiferrobacteraceae bacterium]